MEKCSRPLTSACCMLMEDKRNFLSGDITFRRSIF